MIHFVQQEDTSECHVESTCRIKLQVFQFFLLFLLLLQFWVLRLPVDVLISPLLAMSYWNRSQWNSWDNQWQQQQSPPPPPPSSNPPVSLPSNWRSTSQCWDDQVQYGYRLYRSIQPTGWSRKRNLAGQDPLSVPLSHLTRHGPDEAALRALSEGRFVGIICAKSVAESVFGSQILKTHSAIKESISMLRLKASIASWPLSRAFPIARTNLLSLWHLYFNS